MQTIEVLYKAVTVGKHVNIRVVFRPSLRPAEVRKLTRRLSEMPFGDGLSQVDENGPVIVDQHGFHARWTRTSLDVEPLARVLSSMKRPYFIGAAACGTRCTCTEWREGPPCDPLDGAACDTPLDEGDLHFQDPMKRSTRSR